MFKIKSSVFKAQRNEQKTGKKGRSSNGDNSERNTGLNV